MAILAYQKEELGEKEGGSIQYQHSTSIDIKCHWLCFASNKEEAFREIVDKGRHWAEWGTCRSEAGEAGRNYALGNVDWKELSRLSQPQASYMCMCARPVLVTPTGRIRQVLFLGSKTMAFSIYSAFLSFYCILLHLSPFLLLFLPLLLLITHLHQHGSSNCITTFQF